jgi:hypothetical protein
VPLIGLPQILSVSAISGESAKAGTGLVFAICEEKRDARYELAGSSVAHGSQGVDSTRRRDFALCNPSFAMAVRSVCPGRVALGEA